MPDLATENGIDWSSVSLEDPAPGSEVVDPNAVVDPEKPGDPDPKVEEAADPNKPGEEAEPKLDELLKESEKTTLEQLSALGITPETAKGILERSEAFGAVTDLLQNNPRLFLDEIEKRYPAGFKDLIDAASDRFVDRAQKQGLLDEGDKSPEIKDPVTKALLARIERLESGIKSNEQTAQQQAQAARIEQVKTNLGNAIDTVLAKVPQIAEYEKPGLRALITQSIGRDAQATNRVFNDNLVDVVKHSKTVLQTHFDAKKASVSSEKAKREQVQAKGQQPLPTGAQPSAGQEVGEASWEEAIVGMAKSLTKGGAKK